MVDRDSFFELTTHFGRALMTGLARVDGYPVGVMANNPNFNGGAMDVEAAEKITRFVDLCDTFHLPVVSFEDEPGFMVGVAAERAGPFDGAQDERGAGACARSPPCTSRRCRG